MPKGVPIGTPALHQLAVGSFIWFRPSSALTGSVGGKNMHVTIRPGGAAPPPGNYDIHPPVQDPIYGMVALMVPSASPGSLPFDTVAAKLALANTHPQAFQYRGSPAVVPAVQSVNTLSQPFVLSDKPIPGRNCIVVSAGFADLMDALQASGGTTIKVI
jgi:hypothetical protein